MALDEMLVIMGIFLFLLTGVAFVILVIVILVRFISKKWNKSGTKKRLTTHFL